MLLAYIEEKNAFHVLADQKELDINNLTADDKDHLRDCLDQDCEPCNLCQGDFDPVEAKTRRSFLLNVILELEAM